MINSDRIHVAMTKTCGPVATLACQSNTFNQTKIQSIPVSPSSCRTTSSTLLSITLHRPCWITFHFDIGSRMRYHCMFCSSSNWDWFDLFWCCLGCYGTMLVMILMEVGLWGLASSDLGEQLCWDLIMLEWSLMCTGVHPWFVAPVRWK